jgi:hypothetical protein
MLDINSKLCLCNRIRMLKMLYENGRKTREELEIEGSRMFYNKDEYIHCKEIAKKQLFEEDKIKKVCETCKIVYFIHKEFKDYKCLKCYIVPDKYKMLENRLEKYM